MPRITFEPLADSWLLSVALLIAIVATLVLLSRPRRADASSARSRRGRRAELFLRLCVAALLACFFTRPTIVTTEKEELPASILFLCDASESMSIRDGASGESRYEAMQKAFEDSADTFRALCERFDVRAYAFGSDAQELEIEDGRIAFPEEPIDQESKLGDALADSLRSSAGKRLLGAVVLSDGSQCAKDQDALSTQDAGLRMRDAERIVYAVPFGSSNVSAVTRDVAVLDLRANDHVFLGNELTVSGQVRLLGCANLDVPLTLELENAQGEMEVVAQTTLKPKSQDVSLSYQFVCAPKEAGEWKLCVSAATQEHELIETNNQLSAFVEALDRGVDALYIEGTRRYEQKFLLAALESASDVRVRYWRPSTRTLLAKSPGKTEAELVAQYAKSRKSIEKILSDKSKYAAYLLGDVDATAFQPNELKELLNAVEQGAGLIILAGERSLGPGGYASTPLAKAFPVQTSDTDRLPLESDLAQFDEATPDEQKIRADAEFRASPTILSGRDDFITRLNIDPKKNAELWANMPPVNTLYRLGKLKPNATAYLEATPVDENGKSLGNEPLRPFLVAQQYGLGRVAILASDSTWRWRMRGKETEHAKFWRQLILWAAKFDELLEGELAIELERSRFAVDELVDFRVVYRPKQGEDMSDLKVEADIIAPDGSQERVVLTEENGLWKGSGRKTSEPGDYLIQARLLSGSGETLQTAQARFLAYSRNIELERPEANPQELEALAATALGKTVAPNDFQTLLEELLQQSDTIADYRDVKKRLTDTWTFFALFVALMTIDWILRKRIGMV